MAAMTYESAVISGMSESEAAILAFLTGMMSGCALDDLISNSGSSMKKLGNQLGKSSDEMKDVMGGLKRLAADNNFSSVDDMLDAALNNPTRLPAGLHDDIIEAIDGPMGGFNLPKNVDVDVPRVAEKVELAGDTRNINGQRTSRYKQLTDDEISQLLDDIKALEADPSIFRFNEGNQTSFIDSEGIINVRGDVLPDLDSTHPRDLMSSRAALAHEYYGHKHFNDIFGDRNPLPGSWNDEFRASYNAAINAPNLSDLDRMYLMLDALERAKEAGVNITITEKIRSILYGY